MPIYLLCCVCYHVHCKLSEIKITTTTTTLSPISTSGEQRKFCVVSLRIYQATHTNSWPPRVSGLEKTRILSLFCFNLWCLWTKQRRQFNWRVPPMDYYTWFNDYQACHIRWTTATCNLSVGVHGLTRNKEFVDLFQGTRRQYQPQGHAILLWCLGSTRPLSLFILSLWVDCRLTSHCHPWQWRFSRQTPLLAQPPKPTKLMSWIYRNH